MNKSGLLIKHLRRFDGSPFATIVAIGPNKIGVSICNEKDRFCKKTGLLLALKSAHSGKMPEIPNKNFTMFSPETHRKSNMRVIITEAIDFMKSRSLKYFKSKNTNSIVTTESVSQTNSRVAESLIVGIINKSAFEMRWEESFDAFGNSIWTGYIPHVNSDLYWRLVQVVRDNKVVWTAAYSCTEVFNSDYNTKTWALLGEAKLWCESRYTELVRSTFSELVQ